MGNFSVSRVAYTGRKLRVRGSSPSVGGVAYSGGGGGGVSITNNYLDPGYFEKIEGLLVDGTKLPEDAEVVEIDDALICKRNLILISTRYDNNPEDYPNDWVHISLPNGNEIYTIVPKESTIAFPRALHFRVPNTAVFEGTVRIYSNPDTADPGALYVAGNLEVDGVSYFNGPVRVYDRFFAIGECSLRADVDIHGEVNAYSDVSVIGTLTALSDFVVYGDQEALSDLLVHGKAEIRGNLTAGNDVEVKGNLTVDADLEVKGSIVASNGLKILGGLSTTGYVDLQYAPSGTAAALRVAGNMLAEKNVSITGNLITNGSISGNSLSITNSIVSTGSIASSSYITAGGNLNAGGSLVVAGTTTLYDALTTNKNVDVGGNLTCSGSTALYGSLSVSGVSTFKDVIKTPRVDCNGIIYTGGLVSDTSITVSGNVICDGNYVFEKVKKVGSGSVVTKVEDGGDTLNVTYGSSGVEELEKKFAAMEKKMAAMEKKMAAMEKKNQSSNTRVK